MVKITNLNRRLGSPADKVVQEGKNPANLITGPTRTARDFQKPDPFLGKFKNNPRSDSFYQMFADPEISQEDIDNRVGFYGNTFEGENNARAQEFMNKYLIALGGMDTAEGKALIESPVDPENLRQLSSSPATSGSALADPNVAGRFPSNSVAV